MTTFHLAEFVPNTKGENDFDELIDELLMNDVDGIRTIAGHVALRYFVIGHLPPVQIQELSLEDIQTIRTLLAKYGDYKFSVTSNGKEKWFFPDSPIEGCEQ